jgi:hypothetical protein
MGEPGISPRGVNRIVFRPSACRTAGRLTQVCSGLHPPLTLGRRPPTTVRAQGDIQGVQGLEKPPLRSIVARVLRLGLHCDSAATARCSTRRSGTLGQQLATRRLTPQSRHRGRLPVPAPLSSPPCPGTRGIRRLWTAPCWSIAARRLSPRHLGVVSKVGGWGEMLRAWDEET